MYGGQNANFLDIKKVLLFDHTKPLLYALVVFPKNARK
jgi:hypothetical protein